MATMLGRLLVEDGAASEAAVGAALEEQRESRERQNGASEPSARR